MAITYIGIHPVQVVGRWETKKLLWEVMLENLVKAKKQWHWVPLQDNIHKDNMQWQWV
jgi:hypothetical protein